VRTTFGGYESTYFLRGNEDVTWEITGTAGADYIQALSTKGTRFHALAGHDIFGGSPYDDVFDGGPGTDWAPELYGGSDTCIAVEWYGPSPSPNHDPKSSHCESVTP